MRSATRKAARSAVGVVAAVAALALSARWVGAQRSVLVGTVVSDSSQLPVGGAEVVIGALRRAARADEEGAFVLRALPKGVHVVTARRVGFEPLTARVSVTGAGDTVMVDFALGRRAVTLARVDVTGASAVRTRERTRAREHGGAFVDRTMLARNEQSTMGEVLRRVPGVSVQMVPTPRGTIQALASSRGGQGLALVPGGPKWCFYQIYLDGIRIFTPDSGAEPPAIETFRPVDYEAVEVYRGPAQTPPEYASTGSNCGTVLFWSRSR